MVGSSSSGHDSGINIGKGSADDPVHPLVNLGTLYCAGAKEGGVTVGQILADGMRLKERALFCRKDGELVGSVKAFVFLGCSGLIRVDDKLEVLSSQLANDLAHVDQCVLSVLSVNFL